jgi:hypothetical protein
MSHVMAGFIGTVTVPGALGALGNNGTMCQYRTDPSCKLTPVNAAHLVFVVYRVIACSRAVCYSRCGWSHCMLKLKSDSGHGEAQLNGRSYAFIGPAGVAAGYGGMI